MPRLAAERLDASLLREAVGGGDGVGAATALAKRLQSHLDAVATSARAEDAAVRAVVCADLGGIVELLRGAQRTQVVDLAGVLSALLPQVAPLAHCLDLSSVPVTVTKVRERVRAVPVPD